MAANSKTLAIAAALAAGCLVNFAAAAPIATDPTTPFGVRELLTPMHPAFGAKLRPNHVQPRIRFDPNAAVAESLEILGGASPAANGSAAARRHLRDLEAAETDVARLERYYGEPMERNLDVLKASFGKGVAAPVPWPGSYWPVYEDGINAHRQPFILDVTPGAEVWNQPVRSYEVLEARLVDPQAASRQYFGTSSYPFNADMKQLAFVRTRVSWIVEAYEDGPLVSTGRVQTYTQSVTYEYLLELDNQRTIIGGEWVGDSRQDHPDFFWFPETGIPPDTVTELGMSYKDVRAILDASYRL
ncbi:hypothetical protein PybrP1_000332 [[Pythium] brassicae (nom. inval.)]|nr:hypothetical protein PybrP1_000332 [[Pythium] brassicae (nom. inval.)]